MEEKLEPNACDQCKWRDEARKQSIQMVNAILKGLTKVGRKHFGGKSKTDYTDWVCPDCGQEWTEIEDSGFGGHAWFFRIGRMR